MPGTPYIELTCPVCGKTFVCYSVAAWTYKKYHKDGNIVFCSWGCLQKHNRAIEEERLRKPKAKKRRKRQEDDARCVSV